MAAAAFLNSKNFNFFDVTVTGSISDVVYKTLSKSDNFSLRPGNVTIFKMAAVRNLEFYTLALFVP